MPFYGPLKARCEAAAEAAMPGRVSNLRPGLIVGPLDNSDRFTWWPVRCDRGGEVLAPGDRDGHVQFLDVRDLAAWMLHCLEQNVTGVHNATGFAGRTSMQEVLGACKCATSTPVELVWASEEFLAAEKVQPYMQMPLWIPRDGRSVVDCKKAIAAGLRFRPIADTVRDTLQWAKAERGDKPFGRTGLPAERERELIAKWRKEGKCCARCVCCACSRRCWSPQHRPWPRTNWAWARCGRSNGRRSPTSNANTAADPTRRGGIACASRRCASAAAARRRSCRRRG
jgi:2'-hydroxyisoflavone reductase